MADSKGAEETRLTALDGTNPIGFLAALGVIAVAYARFRDIGGTVEPRLAWDTDGAWCPTLWSDLDLCSLVEAIMQDRETWGNDLALNFSYAKNGKVVRDLKPPPGELHRLLEQALADATPESRRTVDYLAALYTEIATDNGGFIKPTALHFTAGQQQFLSMVRELQSDVTAEDMNEALVGPWTYERKLPVLQWDGGAAREYALRATNPDSDKKTGVPGADWLAFRGLLFLRCAPSGSRIATTGFSGSWKNGAFEWPLWNRPMGFDAIVSLVGHGAWSKISAPERAARGIGAVLGARVRRSDQGGYGSFLPSMPM